MSNEFIDPPISRNGSYGVSILFEAYLKYSVKAGLKGMTGEFSCVMEADDAKSALDLAIAALEGEFSDVYSIVFHSFKVAAS